MQKISVATRVLALIGAAACLIGCAEMRDNESHLILPASGESRGAGQLAAPGEERAAQMENQVTITYTLAAPSPTLREPLVLNFLVSNGLAEPVTLDLGQARKGAFSIAVTRPDGTRVEAERFSVGGISRIGKLTIGPRQTYEQRLLLNEWHGFDVPGAYQLEVRLTTPIRRPDGQEVAADAGFKTAFSVGPRDPARLEQLSAALLNRIEQAGSFEEASEAALELSHIGDPVAVPYLEKSLASAKRVAPTTISGLERMASGEAVQVLALALDDADSEVSQMARSALGTIQRKAKDPRVRESAKRALSKPI